MTATLWTSSVPTVLVTTYDEEEEEAESSSSMTPLPLPPEGDSGCEADVVLADDVASTQKGVARQVEEYLGDGHLSRDAFLRKHVRKARDGFVSLKLIASFKRVKHLCRDWTQVALAVRKYSTILQVNDEGTKVRRLVPLSAELEAMPLSSSPSSSFSFSSSSSESLSSSPPPASWASSASASSSWWSRTVVALDLPPERGAVDAVAEMLSPFGSITLVRMLKPGVAPPPELRSLSARFPQLGSSLCAMAEFEALDAAARALRAAPDLGIKLMSVPMPSGGKSRRESMPAMVLGTSSAPPVGGHRRRATSSAAAVAAASRSNPPPLSTSVSLTKTRHRHSVASLAPPEAGMGTPTSSTGSGMHRHKSASISEGGGRTSPWMQRRLLAARRDSGASSGGDIPDADRQSPLFFLQMGAAAGVSLPDNVIRMPRGPDGTKGFAQGHRQAVWGFRRASGQGQVVPCAS